MQPQVQRSVAYKVWISQLHTAEFVKQQGWNPSYLKLEEKQVSRVNIISTVVGKFISDDGNYGTLTLDDGTDTVRVKAFGPDVQMIKNAKVGALVRFIGKVKEYNEERYVAPEIIKELEDPNWLIVRRLELGQPGNVAVAAPAAGKTLNLIEIITKLDDGKGASIKEVIKQMGLEEADAKLQIAELLASGDIFEPTKGKLKVL